MIEAGEGYDGGAAGEIGALLGAGIRQRQARKQVFSRCLEKARTSSQEVA
jgi:hypothetical protein